MVGPIAPVVCVNLRAYLILSKLGIGNYLRAEILHRANINPFTKARDVFKFTKLDQGFDNIDQNSDRGLILLYLCKVIPLEVLEKGLNKYGNDQEKAAFEAWLTYVRFDEISLMTRVDTFTKGLQQR